MTSCFFSVSVIKCPSMQLSTQDPLQSRDRSYWRVRWYHGFRTVNNQRSLPHMVQILSDLFYLSLAVNMEEYCYSHSIGERIKVSRGEVFSRSVVIDGGV